ncbi:MAG TPA: hypothetical protein VL283_02090 [Candidatus Baltobacteraceae bacterium]|nr:hypothetical protein [Candidatus Baltobacteraceae bacterium]
MNGFEALLAFLTAYANLFFIVAIGAMFAGLAVGRKSRRAAHVVALVSLCACAPIFALYAIATVYRPGVMTLALAALWGWNAWSSWHTWRRTRPARPKSVPTARN